jgi:hypothetical protein
MKHFFTIIICLFIYAATTAQTDSIPNPKDDTAIQKPDTIRIGGIIFTKSKKNKNQVIINIHLGRKKNHKTDNVSTDWWIFDIGFANYSDNTNYGMAGSYLVNKPGALPLGEDDFKLKQGKSVNVNIWFFMQRMNLIKHYLNLKYGLGLELNNYRYNSSISYREGGMVPYNNQITNAPFIFRDSISFSKNKLAADYITVPIMLNFASNPRSPGKNFCFSAGISAGYLYSERNKQISDERGKQKNKGDYDLEPFKISYIAELGLGQVRLYGSYSPASMYQKGLNIKPYTLGIRFSSW